MAHTLASELLSSPQLCHIKNVVAFLGLIRIFQSPVWFPESQMCPNAPSLIGWLVSLKGERCIFILTGQTLILHFMAQHPVCGLYWWPLWGGESVAHSLYYFQVLAFSCKYLWRSLFAGCLLDRHSGIVRKFSLSQSVLFVFLSSV